MLRKHFFFYVLFLISISLQSQIVQPLYDFGSKGIDKAEKLYEKELVKNSEIELLSHINKFPETVSGDRAVLLQANIDVIAGNNNIAEAKLTEFITQRSNSPFIAFAALQRAMIVFELKKYDRAEIFFEAAQIFAENDFEIRKNLVYADLAQTSAYWRAVSMMHIGKHPDAIPVFKYLANKYPDGSYSDDALYSLGRLYEINSKLDSAMYFYRESSKKYAKSNSILVSLIREANINLQLRQPSSALITIEKAENILSHIVAKDSIGLQYQSQSYSENAAEKILYLRGEAYNIAGNYEQAKYVYKNFFEKYPDSPMLMYAKLGMGWALLNLREYNEAIVYYDQIIDTEDDKEYKVKAIAQLYRAIALKRAENREQARKELSALSLQPAYPYSALVLLELGQMYYEAGEFELSRKTLERAERESQDATISVRVNLLLGATFLEMKQWDKAVIEYKKSEVLARNSNEIAMPNRHWYLSETKFKQGIALVQSYRATEAIPALMGFLAESKGDNRYDEALFWLAEAYYRTDLLKNAIESYTRIIKDYPASPRREESIYGLGWSHFRLKEFNSSSKIFDQLISEFPKTKYAVEVLTRQADGYYIEKQFSKAADSYRKASKLSPGTDDGQYASYQLAHSLYRQGSYEQSITSLLDFARLYGKSQFAPNALYLIGWIRFQQKKYNEAIDNFNFMINAYPQSTEVPRAYYAIGDAYYNINQYEEAIKYYKIVIESYPASAFAPEAIKSVQYALIALGREDEAIQIANQYVETNPDSPFAPEFQKKIGEMFYQGRKYQDAITEYEKFLQKHPNNENIPEILYWMGKSYVSLNLPEKANEAFSNLVAKYPKSEFAPVALLENGLLQSELANIDKADSLFQYILTKYTDNENAPQAGFERAVLKFKMGDTISAINLYLDVANKYNETDFGDQARYRVAMYYRNRSDNDSARVHFAKLAIVRDNPNIASESQYRIGELYMREKNYEKAIESFIVIKENFEGFEDWYSLALLNLGECYENIGDLESAKGIYTVLEQVRPDDDYGKTAKTRLKRIKK